MRPPGDRVELSFKQGDILPEVKPEQIFQIKVGQFGGKISPDSLIKPCPGRFYPKGILKGVANVFKENIEPFRLVGMNNGDMDIDFNHPLAGKDLTLTTIIGRVENKDVERGGTSTDWIETLTAGPGMQARWQNNQTDYFSMMHFPGRITHRIRNFTVSHDIRNTSMIPPSRWSAIPMVDSWMMACEFWI
jgi:hypothetical protein